MAKRAKIKKKINTGDDQQSLSNPFASLSTLRDSLPEGEAVEAISSTTVPESPSKEFASKVILRFERKGHGGKTVTVLSGILLMGDARKLFIKELGRALGTNVRAADDDIIIAGDQRERAKSWLEGRGAKRVVTSG